MMMKPTLSAAHPALLPARPALRHGTAAALLAAGQMLQALAQRLTLAPAARPGTGGAPAPALEYHADAGAPEGALYVDGQLVGHLAGVSRL